MNEGCKPPKAIIALPCSPGVADLGVVPAHRAVSGRRTALPALTDPITVPVYKDSALSRWCKRSLYDPRDEVFVRLTLKMAVLFSALMVALAWRFSWPLAIVYGVAWGWFAPPVILMLHNTMHRPFFKQPRWLERVHPYLMSFLFGIPTGYMAHHVGMHHVENNVGEDLSATWRFKRDSALHFLVYFARFFFLVAIELPVYLSRHKRYKLARRVIFGEMAHVSVTALMLWWDWRFGLVAFLLPLVTVRFMMMVGNWGQHAFIDPSQPKNSWVNSITCINSGYNKRCFNDGYHIGHHVKMNRHWAEMPQDFVDTADLAAKEGAIVFWGVDFFLVSVLLWTRRYKFLARRVVRLGSEQTDEQVEALLRSRVLPIRGEVSATEYEPAA
jgi:hypothetical protein